jgi:three-Cys-motif partner protein
MTKLEARNTQTRVKHEILAKYLDTWGGIIVSGLIHARPKVRRFVYVDCFSFIGRYSGEKEDEIQKREMKEVFGSPIIGINALDKLIEHSKRMGIDIRANTILVEKDKKYFSGLKETLGIAGFEDRVQETKNFSSLRNGEIAIVNDDATLIADDLLAFTTQPDTWAFYLIDPFGPSGIPFDFVKKIVSKEKHDVMINFIYEDLLRKTGMCLKERPTHNEKQLVEHWTNAFGGEWWKDIARQTLLQENDANERFLSESLEEYGDSIVVNPENIIEVKEQKFVSAYRDVLYSMDKSLAIKLVNLRFGDKERTMFYLFLTTHDPSGALELNKILYEAKYLEYELRHRLNTAKKNAPPANQMFLIPPDEIKVPEYEKIPRPSVEEIATNILQILQGQKLSRKEVYYALVNTEYFPAEIDKALRLLRRQEKAKFDGDLGHRTVIRFSKSSKKPK